LLRWPLVWMLLGLGTTASVYAYCKLTPLAMARQEAQE